MPKISALPAAASIAAADEVPAVVAGVTKRVPFSMIQVTPVGTLWPLDVVPVTPHAKDDEFTGSSLDGKWTSPANSLAGAGVTNTVSAGWLRMIPTATPPAVVGVYGIRQNAPTGSFTVSAKIEDLAAEISDGVIIGLWVGITGGLAWIYGQCPFTTGGPYIIYALQFSTYSETVAWGAHVGGVNSSVTVAAGAVRPKNGRWFRIQYTTGSGTLAFYNSTDGIVWRLQTSAAGIAQPTRIGLGFGGAVPNQARQLGVKWFRVTEP